MGPAPSNLGAGSAATCREAANDCAEIKLLAERGLGAILATMEKQTGGDAARARSHDATELVPTLAVLDISLQSFRWQALH